MKQVVSSSRIVGWVAVGLTVGGSFAIAPPTLAQIIPDDTLPTPSSVSSGCNVCTIEGGTQRGNNLFHSFTEFSVPTGGEAVFNNLVSIDHVFSRVTGNTASNIDGLIQANGSADLFLINPNGIFFGPNTQLDIGGSFIASTASSLKFEDFSFNSLEPQEPPLLAVSTPIGLGYTNNSEPIQMMGMGGRLSFDLGLGLSVQPGKTLALAGGDISLEQSYLGAPSGRIELGGVSNAGTVNLTPVSQGWVLDYRNIRRLGNISLFRMLIDSSIEDASLPNTLVENSAIFIRASDFTLERSSLINADSFTSAQAGDIFIDVNQLTLRGGSAIASRAFSNGSGGNIVVNATDAVEVIGVLDAGFFEFSSALSTSNGEFDLTGIPGDAGNIIINTPVLKIQEGAIIGATTSGSGDGGNININASELVQISGTSDIGSASSLFASARATSTGDAGSLFISTPVLIVQNGAEVSALTEPESRGNGGQIIVDSRNITVANEASITVESRGNGIGGGIRINSESLTLENGALLSARTASNLGGNISLQIQDIILLRQNSNISATAGIDQAGGDGGNININIRGGFVAAVSEENSDITANAFEGDGGNINISTQALLGITPQDNLTPFSDITASSEFGVRGTIQINNLDLEPNQGLVELPSGLLDSAQLLAQGCGQPAVAAQGEFFNSGRGGIGSLPSEALVSDDVIDDLRLPTTWPDQAPIAEAQGWFVSETGDVVLSAVLATTQARCWR